MYKLSDEVINLIEKTMKTRRVELTAGGRSLAEAKIQKDIFYGDAMMSLNHILRKCTAGYTLSRSQDQSNNVHG